MRHEFKLRVFYEDTDMAGIVYYANYLRFIERGRSSMLREAGYSQMELRDRMETVFAVTEVAAKYRKPARLDDELTVATTIADMTRARVLFRQLVLRGDQTLFEADVTVASMSLAGRPKPLPDAACNIFEQFRA